MSIALLPGRTLRVALASSLLLTGVYPSDCSASWPEDSSPTDGDGGPIWTSVSGGGLGKRGEVDDWTPAVAIVERDSIRKREKGIGGKRTSDGRD